jgi:hypothetical protein
VPKTPAVEYLISNGVGFAFARIHAFFIAGAFPRRRGTSGELTGVGGEKHRRNATALADEHRAVLRDDRVQ